MHYTFREPVHSLFNCIIIKLHDYNNNYKTKAALLMELNQPAFTNLD
jgi:hypothetical protein